MPRNICFSLSPRGQLRGNPSTSSRAPKRRRQRLCFPEQTEQPFPTSLKKEKKQPFPTPLRAPTPAPSDGSRHRRRGSRQRTASASEAALSRLRPPLLVLPHRRGLSPRAPPPPPPLPPRLPTPAASSPPPPLRRPHQHPVLVLPGLAAGSFSFRRLLSPLSSRGLVAAAIDLPGQGLSPPPPAPPSRANPLREIMDHGIFHAFEHLVETGEVPFQEAGPDPSHYFYAATEAAAAVARAVDVLGLAPVHLVLHDSALTTGAAFVSANPPAVQSVTLIDTTATLPAFPAAVLGVPVLGRMVLWVPALFKGLMRLCCARGMDAEEADAHRTAMRGEGKRDAVFEAWKAMNQSFDLREWRGSSEEVKRLPMMVLWSGSWSDKWIDEGKRVTTSLPDIKFAYHYGGRWPQVDACEEISKLIAEFVTLLPTTATEYVDQSSDELTDAHSDHAAS